MTLDLVPGQWVHCTHKPTGGVWRGRVELVEKSTSLHSGMAIFLQRYPLDDPTGYTSVINDWQNWDIRLLTPADLERFGCVNVARFVGAPSLDPFEFVWDGTGWIRRGGDGGPFPSHLLTLVDVLAPGVE